MFWKRKAAAPSPPRGSGDPEMDQARAALATRQERIAQLELDLLNSQTDLAAFNAEIERRLGPMQKRLETLEAELAEAKRKASRRAMWGERASSPDIPEDVVAQYTRIWGWGSKPSEPDPASAARPAAPPSTTLDESELKTLYRSLAKRFHPDLAQDPSEKPWRERMMTRVNDAYRAQDLAALRRLAEEGQPSPTPPPGAVKTREQVLDELRAEMRRLERLAASLEEQLDALARSPGVQLKLEALWARRAGGDLLADMGRQLQTEITRAENELALLR